MIVISLRIVGRRPIGCLFLAVMGYCIFGSGRMCISLILSSHFLFRIIEFIIIERFWWTDGWEKWSIALEMKSKLGIVSLRDLSSCLILSGIVGEKTDWVVVSRGRIQGNIVLGLCWGYIFWKYFWKSFWTIWRKLSSVVVIFGERLLMFQR